MLATGIGVILAALIQAALVIGLVLGGAYALTTYVELPGFVDTLIWIGAGGYALLCVVTTFTVLAALATDEAQVTRRLR